MPPRRVIHLRRPLDERAPLDAGVRTTGIGAMHLDETPAGDLALERVGGR